MEQGIPVFHTKAKAEAERVKSEAKVLATSESELLDSIDELLEDEKPLSA